MRIQYDTQTNGTLLLKDPETERIVVLSDSYWDTTNEKSNFKRYHHMCSSNKDAEISDDLFDLLYHEIRRHKKSINKLHFTNTPEVLKLRNSIEGWEETIVRELEDQGAKIKDYTWIRDLEEECRRQNQYSKPAYP